MNFEIDCLLIKPAKSIPIEEILIPSIELTDNRYDSSIRNYVYHLFSKEQSNFSKLNSFIKQLFPKIPPTPKLTGNQVEQLVETDHYEISQIDINKMGDGIKNALLILSRILLSGNRVVLLDVLYSGLNSGVMSWRRCL